VQGSTCLPHPFPLPTGEGIRKEYNQEIKTPLLRALSIGLAFSGILALFSLVHALEVPPLRGRVNDLAGLMSPIRARVLEERLASFEKETGHQIAVLTIHSLEGEDLEGFSIRVAETWKIGQKGFDNGAILLIARDDRKLRIEVGYGLEGVLSDALASRIIREIIVPRFHEGDYTSGIEAGMEAILKVTQGEALPIPGARKGTPKMTDLFLATGMLFMAALLALIVGITQPTLLRAAFGGAIGAAIMGSLAGASAVGPGIWILTLLVGSAVGIWGSHYARQSWGRAWTVRGSRRYERWLDGSWGPSVGSGGYVGGFGGGDFSGGGGGFGGGGASGGW